MQLNLLKNLKAYPKVICLVQSYAKKWHESVRLALYLFLIIVKFVIDEMKESFKIKSFILFVKEKTSDESNRDVV